MNTSVKTIDPFSNLLQQQRDLDGSDLRKDSSASSSESLTKTQSTIQKAERPASLEDFIEMLSGLVCKSMKSDNVIFEPDEGARLQNDASTKIESPHIFYEIVNDEPKGEIKPRSRETVKEIMDNGQAIGRPGLIFGQKFKCTVQFNIFASGYKEANKVMNSLEDLIFRYTGYLKKNGVAEILYKRHFTDRTLDTYRQHLSVRSLQYYIEIEKNYVTFATEFRDISVNR